MEVLSAVHNAVPHSLDIPNAAFFKPAERLGDRPPVIRHVLAVPLLFVSRYLTGYDGAGAANSLYSALRQQPVFPSINLLRTGVNYLKFQR